MIFFLISCRSSLEVRLRTNAGNTATMSESRSYQVLCQSPNDVIPFDYFYSHRNAQRQRGDNLRSKLNPLSTSYRNTTNKNIPTKLIEVKYRLQGTRVSSVAIATRYGLDGPGIESWCVWGGDSPHPSRPTLGPTQLPVQLAPALSRG